MAHADIVIAGAGIIGLTLARELVSRGQRALLLDKEDAPGKHASGRNSGDLHAGISYAPGGAKAATCLTGNRLMRGLLPGKRPAPPGVWQGDRGQDRG